jgi:RNA polymerase sigma factor (sigma-70 family)
MHDDDATDLRRFAEDGDEEAFAALVRRHLGLVYAAALRQLNGDAHLAQDVAQSVFTDLARKAEALAPRAATLAGWLYTSTHHAAAKAVRAEQRRRRREQEAHAMQEITDESARDEAWAQVRPHLDTLMQRLSREDRDAIVQRYFVGRNFPEMAAALGVSESGARMRVERALEKLRQHLEGRGIRSTMAALGAVLATEAVAAPPAGMAATITAAALAKAGTAGLAVVGLGIFGMTKIQTTLVATAAAAGLAVVGVQVRELRRAQVALDAVLAAGEQSAPAAAVEPPQVEPVAPTSIQEPPLLAQLRAEKAALEAGLRERSSPKPASGARKAPAPPVSPLAGTAFTEPLVDIKELDVLPRPVAQVSPLYPWDLRGIPGEAMVSFVITASGEVADVQPEDANHPAFAISAMDAVARWKFSPGQLAGAPVNVRVVQPMRFVWNEEDWF